MTLPDKVQIGPISYAVKEKTDLHRVNGDGQKVWLHGHVVYGDAEIRVAYDQDEQVKIAVLWHEALHAMLYAAGLDDSEFESHIRALGYGLVQLVRDNPALVQATIGESRDDEADTG